MENDDLIYLIAGVLREMGLTEFRISEETIRQVMLCQDEISARRDDGDWAVVISRRPGLVLADEG